MKKIFKLTSFFNNDRASDVKITQNRNILILSVTTRKYKRGNTRKLF
nr:MAG TPA: hypothetical protein [Caudoviricetes sp.]